jgi:hypothetical protein
VVTAKNGNVFADLGLPNAEELGTKVRLAVREVQVVKQKIFLQSNHRRHDGKLQFFATSNGASLGSGA